MWGDCSLFTPLGSSSVFLCECLKIFVFVSCCTKELQGRLAKYCEEKGNLLHKKVCMSQVFLCEETSRHKKRIPKSTNIKNVFLCEEIGCLFFGAGFFLLHLGKYNLDMVILCEGFSLLHITLFPLSVTEIFQQKKKGTCCIKEPKLNWIKRKRNTKSHGFFMWGLFLAAQNLVLFFFSNDEALHSFFMRGKTCCTKRFPKGKMEREVCVFLCERTRPLPGMPLKKGSHYYVGLPISSFSNYPHQTPCSEKLCR